MLAVPFLATLAVMLMMPASVGPADAPITAWSALTSRSRYDCHRDASHDPKIDGVTVMWSIECKPR